MAIKKIGIKKSETTLAGVVYSLLIVIGFFSVVWLWLEANSQGVAVPITDTVYNESYTDLQGQQTDLDRVINNFRDSVKALTEPGENFGISWNGLKGLLGVFLVPIILVDMGVEVLNVVIAPIASFIPTWILTLLKIGVIAFIIFIIASIFKGDSNVIR
jgi:di/tricarboxylate transporter